jgi:hypothetical protein
MATTTITDAKLIMQAIFRIPSITGYNRLEAAPRTADLDTGLAAAVRDPLWMLTRQWQFGEFQAEDAGSPINATILGEHTPIDRISLGGKPAIPYDPGTPLETSVEREPLKGSLALAVQVARYFLKLMGAKTLNPVYKDNFISGYPLDYPIDPNDKNGLQLNAAVGTVLFDGWALLKAANTPQGTGTAFSTWLATQGSINSTDQGILIGLTTDLNTWFNRTWSQPPGGQPNTAWEPSQLEYQFQLGSPVSAAPAGAVGSQKILSATQFYGGHLDWYSFDVDTAGRLPLQEEPADPAPVVENVVSFIPSPVSFKGMPNPRFWMMEDSRTDFGKIDTSATGLLHLLLAEFGLVYGNDWFMLPYPLTVNTICDIKGLVVTDVFGEHILVKPVTLGTDDNWQQWALFHQSNVDPKAPVNHLFYLAPAVAGSQQNDPLEQVNFLRDEVASMVWAVEDRVPSQAGQGVSGNQMAQRAGEPPVFTPAGTAAIRYVLGTTVPDNWIPFIPVHIEGSVTEIQFQRAAMPGAKGALGQIITETPAPYYIREEEIPRGGIIVRRALNRARWLDGSTFVWMGRSKETGTGEGWSNLKFDQIVPIPAPPEQPAPAPPANPPV